MRPFFKISQYSARKNQRGVAIVEFALVAMLFFILLFSIIDFGYLFFGYLSMQHAVREGSRFSVVSGPSVTRCTDIQNKISGQSMGFFAKSSASVSYQIVNSTTGLPAPAPANTCGSKNQMVMIEVSGKLPLLTLFLKPFFSGNLFTYTVRSTMMNENF